MKKLFLLALMFGVLFMFAACNTSDGGGGDDDATDIVYSWGEPGYVGTPGNSTDRPGVMLALNDSQITITNPNGGDAIQGDISLYGEIILDAVLYSAYTDAENNTIATYADGLAQFHLLTDGDWKEPSQLTIGYNMKVEGESTGTVKSGASGKPINVVVMNDISKGELARIEFRKLTLKLRTDLPFFEVVYGSKVSVSGNRITFNDAQYGEGAVLYQFDPGDLPLTDKTVTIAFRIEGGDDEKEYQLNVQAAGDGTNKKNGSNTDDGQKYITLDDYMDKTTTKAGSFTLDGSALEKSAETTGGSDNDAPFELGGFRIENNGTVYQDHIRNKSYTLIIDSVTVSNN